MSEAEVIDAGTGAEVEAAGSEPIARFYGQPVVDLPLDLYIPPDALEVFLETFEGPLDLLLYLIRKNNLSVLDIQMATLTRQYMEYVEAMRRNQLELAAEYLVMAAWLVEIKSRMLLPKPQHAEDEERDPRAELVRRLLEYEQMKLAAARLDELPQVERDFALVQVWIEQAAEQLLPQVSADDLREAWMSVLARAKVHAHHRIVREALSVRSHMTRVLRRLREGGFVPFTELFDPQMGVQEVIVTFLAILELARESLAEISQQAPYEPIYVRSRVQ